MASTSRSSPRGPSAARPSPPISFGASIQCTSSTRSARKSAAASRPPPSTSTVVRPSVAQVLALAVFATVVLAAGLFYENSTHSALRWAGSVAAVISLMHFWYDGFVWSVQKHEV